MLRFNDPIYEKASNDGCAEQNLLLRKAMMSFGDVLRDFIFGQYSTLWLSVGETSRSMVAVQMRMLFS